MMMIRAGLPRQIILKLFLFISIFSRHEGLCDNEFDVGNPWHDSYPHDDDLVHHQPPLLSEYSDRTSSSPMVIPASISPPLASVPSSPQPAPHKVSFECPKHVQIAENDNFDDYWRVYLEMGRSNWEDLSNFRHRGFDYRQHSFEDFKAMAQPFKSAFFGTVLQSGDAIFESACGQGLNLLSTVEILNETDNITDLSIHGNDYLPESIRVAKKLLTYEQDRYNKMKKVQHHTNQNDDDDNHNDHEQHAAGPLFHKGTFCAGDSTRLNEFVPANSFDLAYTGFIDPILDPLDLLGPNATIAQTEALLGHICEEAEREVWQNSTSFHFRELLNDMQHVQQDWFASWVKELLRIVKPGKFVVIEDVGWPSCSGHTENWGGVDPSWWETSIATHGWDVYADSMIIVEAPWYQDRYNVRMQRRHGDDDHNTEGAAEERLRIKQESLQRYQELGDQFWNDLLDEELLDELDEQLVEEWVAGGYAGQEDGLEDLEDWNVVQDYEDEEWAA